MGQSAQELLSLLNCRERAYKIEAYFFILNCLEFGTKSIKGHISGQELCSLIKQVLIQQYGFFAPDLLEEWNIKETRDFGNIIYELIELKTLGKTDKDDISHFDNVYDFNEVFNKEALYKLGFDEYKEYLTRELNINQ